MLIHPGVKLMLMINAEMSSPTMELVPLLCLCLLARSGSVFADGTDPVLKDRTEVNIPGAASKPFVTNLDQTDKWALLQCEVLHAFPEPKLQFKDSSGNNLDAGGSKVTINDIYYDVVIQTTVTKTGNYTCVVTQKEIHHQTVAGTFVHFHGSSSKGVVPRVIFPLLFVALLVTVG